MAAASSVPDTSAGVRAVQATIAPAASSGRQFGERHRRRIVGQERDGGPESRGDGQREQQQAPAGGSAEARTVHAEDTSGTDSTPRAGRQPGDAPPA